MNSKVRTRVAPSPTGFPHMGTIYQALFDFAYAHRHNGQFLVRVEDTDQSRTVHGALEKIYEALDWFSLVEDESSRKGGGFGPYLQSERLPIYKEHAQKLLDTGHAYYCFCTKERLEEVRNQMQKDGKSPMYDKHCRNISKEEIESKLSSNQEYVIRLKVPENEKIVTKDEIRGEVVFDSHTVDDQVLMKADGFPTYHLAAIVDDHLMEITHVLRGEEWLPSSPKHTLLYRFFGWEPPLYFHTPTIRNPDKSKFSKRQGHTNVSWYQENGYLPEAILNFIALLGWSHPEGKEIFSLDEFIQVFNLKDIIAVGPIFDLQKLTWMNQQYIQNLTNEDLKKRLHVFSATAKNMEESLLDALLPLIKTRMETLADFEVLTKHFTEEPQIILRSDTEKAIVDSLLEGFENLNTWNSDEILSLFRQVMEAYRIRMPILYYVLTGVEKGLPLPESVEILGKEKTVTRLKQVAHSK